MTEDHQKPAAPRLASSDDIPLAVAFLISLVIRWVCFALTLPFGLLAIVALMEAWSWWILIPSTVMTLGFFVVGNLIVPQGRLVFDSRCPYVIVPSENPLDLIPPNGNGKKNKFELHGNNKLDADGVGLSNEEIPPTVQRDDRKGVSDGLNLWRYQNRINCKRRQPASRPTQTAKPLLMRIFVDVLGAFVFPGP